MITVKVINELFEGDAIVPFYKVKVQDLITGVASREGQSIIDSVRWA